MNNRRTPYVFNNPSDEGAGEQQAQNNKSGPDIEDIKQEWFNRGFREGLLQKQALEATHDH